MYLYDGEVFRRSYYYGDGGIQEAFPEFLGPVMPLP